MNEILYLSGDCKLYLTANFGSTAKGFVLTVASAEDDLINDDATAANGSIYHCVGLF